MIEIRLDDDDEEDDGDDTVTSEDLQRSQRILKAISWLPNENFDNDGGSLDGFPLFAADEPYEIIWSYKDVT